MFIFFVATTVLTMNYVYVYVTLLKDHYSIITGGL